MLLLAAHIAIFVMRCPHGRFRLRFVGIRAVFLLGQRDPDSFVYAAEV